MRTRKFHTWQKPISLSRRTDWGGRGERGNPGSQRRKCENDRLMLKKEPDKWNSKHIINQPEKEKQKIQIK